MLHFGRVAAGFILCTALAAGSAVVANPANAYDGWRQTDSTTIESKAAGWDYLTLDAATGRLYIGHHEEGLQVFDLATKKVIKVIGDTAKQSSNGATLMPEFDLGISNNENGTITPFKLSTMEARPSIKIADDIDFSHYDPVTKRLVFNVGADDEGVELIVLQAPGLEKVGEIKLKSKKPERAAADGRGNLFLAGRDTERVYKIDTKTLKVVAEFPTSACGGPNTVALDMANNRIMLGCRGNTAWKPGFAVMDATTGKMIYAAEIGSGNDAIAYDADLKRIFLTNGVHASLHVFEQVDANTYRPTEVLGTLPGVRTMAMDAKSKKIYAVTAEGSADMSKKVATGVSSWHPNTYVPNTFKVLTYSKN